jgi:hypothetical protein
MDDRNKRVTVGVKELALSNSLTLTALVELLEEKGVISKTEVLDRIKHIRELQTKRTI